MRNLTEAAASAVKTRGSVGIDCCCCMQSTPPTTHGQHRARAASTFYLCRCADGVAELTWVAALPGTARRHPRCEPCCRRLRRSPAAAARSAPNLQTNISSGCSFSTKPSNKQQQRLLVQHQTFKQTSPGVLVSAQPCCAGRCQRRKQNAEHFISANASAL